MTKTISNMVYLQSLQVIFFLFSIRLTSFIDKMIPRCENLYSTAIANPLSSTVVSGTTYMEQTTYTYLFYL